MLRRNLLSFLGRKMSRIFDQHCIDIKDISLHKIPTKSIIKILVLYISLLFLNSQLFMISDFFITVKKLSQS